MPSEGGASLVGETQLRGPRGGEAAGLGPCQGFSTSCGLAGRTTGAGGLPGRADAAEGGLAGTEASEKQRLTTGRLLADVPAKDVDGGAD